MKKSLYIVDIFSFIFRAYYAVRPLNSPSGVPVNAVYGVISMLKKLIETKKPDHLVVCMDSKESFRKEIYPAYKANRSAPPEDLMPQIPLIEEFIRTYPMVTFSVSGFEADDIIATLVTRFTKQPDMEIFIVSPDKDLMQLVDDHVFLYDTMKEKIMTRKDVVEKFGVQPEQVVHVQSLCGDSTDNIPGIAGVGPKTASKLIQDYGTLNGVFENVEKLAGKMREKIQEGREAALTSQKLVSLRHDVPLDVVWSDLEFKPIDNGKLNEFYQKLGFKSLIKNPPKNHEPASPIHATAPAKFMTVENTESLKNIVADFLKDKKRSFVFDTETDSLNTHTACLVGISFCFDLDHAYYIPIGHQVGNNLSIADVCDILNPIFSDPLISKVAQNAKFDINVLHQHGFVVSGLHDDTLIASYLISPEGSHSLDTLASHYLHYQMVAFHDVVKKGENFSNVDIATATRYSAEDAWAVFAILDFLKKELTERHLDSVYHDVEIPLVTVLAEMEQSGILVDRSLLSKLDLQFRTRLGELEKEIHASAGVEFNVSSPKQLAEILFTKLHLPIIKKTKTGPSTDVDVLTALAHQHELPKFLLEYRMLSKLLSTYVEQLTELINPKTGRIHSHFNQAIVATGRLSSTEPNLQNIPIKTPMGRRIREVFIAAPGCEIFSADYSQIELRLLAAFSKDPHLMEAYQNNEDIHRKTAAHILGLSLTEVSDAQRAIGKTINFGVIYGQSAFGLAQMLEVPQEQAKRFIEKFYQEFASVRDYKKTVLNEAKKNGFVSTFLGRRRYLPDLNSRNKMAELNAERAAFNAVFQGSAADLIKKAMILITAAIKKENLQTKMILQVHDELLFEVPTAEKNWVQKHVPHIMETTFTLDVPIKVSSKFGKNWDEAH